jgi:hypothetical protein
MMVELMRRSCMRMTRPLWAFAARSSGIARRRKRAAWSVRLAFVLRLTKEPPGWRSQSRRPGLLEFAVYPPRTTRSYTHARGGDNDCSMLAVRSPLTPTAVTRARMESTGNASNAGALTRLFARLRQRQWSDRRTMSITMVRWRDIGRGRNPLTRLYRRQGKARQCTSS